jgi:hypothetical protein
VCPCMYQFLCVVQLSSYGVAELNTFRLVVFVGEASEVTAANPWIVYGDPLHKLREFGASIKEMDLLDESALSSEQMRVMCAIL